MLLNRGFGQGLRNTLKNKLVLLRFWKRKVLLIGQMMGFILIRVSLKDYGRLARLKLESLKGGKRVGLGDKPK